MIVSPPSFLSLQVLLQQTFLRSQLIHLPTVCTIPSPLHSVTTTTTTTTATSTRCTVRGLLRNMSTTTNPDNTVDTSTIKVIDSAISWANDDPNEITSSYVKKLIEEAQQQQQQQTNDNVSSNNNIIPTDKSVAIQTLMELFPPDNSRISFGTAGLRSAMKPGPLGMNDLTVIQSAQGIARYCQQQQQQKEQKELNQPKEEQIKIVIGYDHRSNSKFQLSSKDFAIISKLVFDEAGFECILLHDYVATPLIAYATTKLGATVGIMVTASHNPKEDAGYKVYWKDGVQIRPPIDSGIAQAIQEQLKPWVDYKSRFNEHMISHGIIDKSSSSSSSSSTTMNDGDQCYGLSSPDITTQLADQYFDAIKTSGLITGQYQKWIEATTNSDPTNKPPRICYTAMHGIGHKWAQRANAVFNLQPFYSTPSQQEPNAEFPTVVFPNPEEKGALSLAMKYASLNDCDLVIANDPDADRLAVAERIVKEEDGEESWTTFSGDQIGVMLGHWIWEQVGKTCDKPVAMCASTVSSKMLARIAEVEGFHFEDTLTGFKWIGSRALDLEQQGYRTLFAYEEAIGFCCGDIVHDKDGLTALGVLSELAIQKYHSKSTLTSHMQSLYDKYGEFCSKNGYFFCHDPKAVPILLDKIRNNGEYMTHVGSYAVESIRDLGYPGFDSTTPDKKPILPLSKSSPILTIRFTNSCVAQFRSSGTEPKFKYYIEMRGMPGVHRDVVKKDLDVMAGVILEELLHPTENGLERP